MPTALADAHIEAERRLRLLVTTGLERAWRQLPGYDEEHVDGWLSQAVPLVLSGQRTSVALTDAYVARSMGRDPFGIDPDAVIGGLRGDTTPEEVYRRPFVTVWTALKDARLDGISTGEYITSADARPREKDYITQLVREAKESRARDGEIAARLSAAHKQASFPKPDVVLSIPPDPGKADRFAGIRARVASDLGSQALDPPLRERADIPGYRGMTISERRAATAKLGGRFIVTDPARIRGKRVLLLDDVVVSGEQAREAIGALKAAGAKDVKFTALARAKGLPEALDAGLARATGSGAMDVQMAARGTFEAAEETEDGIYGYQRVADGAACAFCQMIDGAYVKSADAMALHNGCGCSLEPLTRPHARAAELPSGVSVHEHGELGQVLTDPAHNFTSEAQALG